MCQDEIIHANQSVVEHQNVFSLTKNDDENQITNPCENDLKKIELKDNEDQLIAIAESNQIEIIDHEDDLVTFSLSKKGLKPAILLLILIVVDILNILCFQRKNQLNTTKRKMKIYLKYFILKLKMY